MLCFPASCSATPRVQLPVEAVFHCCSQALCTAGADPAAASAKGVTALLLAAKHNRAAVVQHMVTQCSCSCSQADSNGTTPLMAAAGAAARDVVVLLLQHVEQWGVQLAAEDAAGDGAVAYAARGGDAEVLQMLAAAGLSLTAQWPRHLQSSTARGCTQQGAACSADLAGAAAAASQPPGCMKPPACSSSVLNSVCLDGSDALMNIAAGAGSVGVVAWLLQQGVGKRAAGQWELPVAQERRTAACCCTPSHHGYK
jgi:ankyrin repeat protein